MLQSLKHVVVRLNTTTLTSSTRDTRKHSPEAQGATCKSLEWEVTVVSWESTFLTFRWPNRMATEFARMIILQWAEERHRFREYAGRIQVNIWTLRNQVLRLSNDTSTGHHVYVEFSGNNPITITVATSSSFTFNRRWHFHLQQIGCDSTSKGLISGISCLTQKASWNVIPAPSGCLQYWMDSSGWVSSFNYAAAASGAANSIGVQGSRQIAGLSYGACVKAAAGQCSITWSRVRLKKSFQALSR